MPDLTGLEIVGGEGKYLKSEPKVYVEGFYTKDGGRVAKMRAMTMEKKKKYLHMR